MSNLKPQLHNRDFLFSQQTWYTIQPVRRPEIAMSAGFDRKTPAIEMTTNGILGSQNWQLFPQAGRYFIRNWEWGSNYQLGVDRDNTGSAPLMFPRSGSVSQQWTIQKVDGGFEITNGLLGNGTKLVLLAGEWAPLMRGPGWTGVWNITRNESADRNGPKNPEMYNEVVGFEVLQPSSSLSSSTTQSPPLSTTSSQSNLPPLNPLSSSALSGGVIAGIVIGSIAGLAVLLALAFVLMRRKKRKAAYQVHDKTADATGPYTETSASRGELEAPPTELPIQDMRTELGPGPRA